MSYVLPHLPVGRRGVDDPVCNPHLLRLPRLDDAAGEDEVEGAGEADQLGEADLKKEANNTTYFCNYSAVRTHLQFE